MTRRPDDVEIAEAVRVLRQSMTGERTWLELRRRTNGNVDLVDVDDLLPPVDHPLRPYAIEWSTFWQDDDDGDDDGEWLCEPLIARGRAHALYAAAKTGKSYLALAIATAAIATGRPFLQKPAGDPVSVVYCDFEMTVDDIRDRLGEAFGYSAADDLSRLHYVVLPDIDPLDTEAGGRALMESVAAWRAEAVFLDTTGRAVVGDENDADTIRDYYRHTGQRLKAAGVTVVRLDHAGKDTTRGQRGTSAKADDVDIVARLDRTDTGVSWTNTHRRVGWVPQSVAVTITEDDAGRTSFALSDDAWPAGTADAATDLDAAQVPLRASTRAAVDLLRAAGTPRRRQVVLAALRYRRDAAERAGTTPFSVVVPKTRNTAPEPTDEMPATTGGNRDRDRPEPIARTESGPAAVTDKEPPVPKSRPTDEVEVEVDDLDRPTGDAL